MLVWGGDSGIIYVQYHNAIAAKEKALVVLALNEAAGPKGFQDSGGPVEIQQNHKVSSVTHRVTAGVTHAFGLISQLPLQKIPDPQRPQLSHITHQQQMK